MVKEIDATEFEALLRAGKAFVCDFWASWCGPCRMLAPVMEEVSDAYPETPFVKVNVDEYGELAGRYNVMSIPFVAVFEAGKMKAHSVGYIPAEEMRDFVKESVSLS